MMNIQDDDRKTDKIIHSSSTAYWFLQNTQNKLENI